MVDIDLFDLVVIGAGAAGMMCAAVSGQRGRRVLVLDSANKVGKKILMSGGGRCNFTNVNTSYDNYISHNPHFFKSALTRYTPWDFIQLVESYHIQYYEKTLGQLFCREKSQQIVDMLLSECEKSKMQGGSVTIYLNQKIQKTQKIDSSRVLESRGIFSCYWKIKTDQEVFHTKKVVVATGGLSIPTMGASAFGYEIARQFGLKVWETRAGLVPYTLQQKDKMRFEVLSGISVLASVKCRSQSFTEQLLFTHRGLSGPVILQISSYWYPGDDIDVCLLPELDLYAFLEDMRQKMPDQHLKTVLTQKFARRLLSVFLQKKAHSFLLERPMRQFTDLQLREIADIFQNWTLKPNGTEGYRTAEVTVGGVDCDEVSSKTFESKKVKGLYFIGEVLDVTGWLGGYNFQWAWASAQACAQSI